MVASYLLKRLKKKERVVALDALTKLQGLGLEQIESVDSLVVELQGKAVPQADVVTRMKTMGVAEQKEVCSWLLQKEWVWEAVEAHPRFEELVEERKATEAEEAALKGQGAAVLQAACVLQGALRDVAPESRVALEAVEQCSGAFGAVAAELQDVRSEAEVATRFVDFPVTEVVDSYKGMRRVSRVLLQGAVHMQDGAREVEVVVNLVKEGKGYRVICSQGEVKGVSGEGAAALSRLCSQDMVERVAGAAEAMHRFKVAMFRCTESVVEVANKEKEAWETDEEYTSILAASGNGSMCTVKSLDIEDGYFSTVSEDDVAF